MRGAGEGDWTGCTGTEEVKGLVTVWGLLVERNLLFGPEARLHDVNRVPVRAERSRVVWASCGHSCCSASVPASPLLHRGVLIPSCCCFRRAVHPPAQP